MIITVEIILCISIICISFYVAFEYFSPIFFFVLLELVEVTNPQLTIPVQPKFL